jgi:hypothetical protein
MYEIKMLLIFKKIFFHSQGNGSWKINKIWPGVLCEPICSTPNVLSLCKACELFILIFILIFISQRDGRWKETCYKLEEKF